ncbi:MAG TPA: helix-turn-helix domain-containing protein [Pirellulales bacterium]|nr:helix-turn-helix domain-containing protein [Pirellulales bacterium]
MSTKNDPPLMNVRDVAEQLGVSTRTVQTMIAAGELPTVRVRRAVRFRPSDVRAYIDRGNAGPGTRRGR